MADQSRLSHRFEQLAAQLEAVAKTKNHREGTMVSGDVVDDDLFLNWKLKAKHLLSMACGESSLHVREFVARENAGGYILSHGIMLRLKAVFEAAREDFEGGYCNTIRTLIQSEVFDSELEQARALLDGGYLPAAAVIAGVVLETTLRQLCDNHQIPYSKLDKMNADLVKAGQYSVLKQKQVTVWADIRNNAAHGHPEKFSRDDVDDMIAKIEAFVADQLS